MKKFDVENYVFSKLERVKKGSTGQLTAVCPWCSKHGSFYIDVETGNYICFKCEQKGRHLIGIIAIVEGFTWLEARAFLLRKLHETRRRETIPSLIEKISNLREAVEDEDEDEKVIELPKEFIPVYKNGRWTYPVYLKKRGIKKKTAKVWGLGFCNRGRYWNRLVIPIKCPNGVSFTSRDVTGELNPKYLNPKECPFQSHLLHGWPQIKKNGDLILVEGPMDAIKLWQHGLPALSLGGKVLHPKQLKMLAEFSKDSSLTIMLDPEERLAPLSVASQLALRFEQVFVASLPLGVDPGSSTAEQAEEAYDKAILYDGKRGKVLKAKMLSLKETLKKRYF